MFWGRLIHDDRGMGSVEFALVAIVLFVFMFGTIDFGRAMWQWNSARQGVERAVRHAVVNNFVASGLEGIDGVALAGGNGLMVPLAAVPTIVCDASTCSGAFGPRDPAAYDAIVGKIRDYFPAVDGPGVQVEVIYEHVGLGFSGNPFGSDIVPMVTVRMTGMTFAPVTPGVSGFGPLAMPDFTASLSGEDGQTPP